MHRIYLLATAAALALASSPALAGPTSPELLGGLPSDYEVIGGAIPRNKTTGEMGRSNNANGYIFIEARYRIVGGKLVPQYPLPAPALSQQDTDDLAVGRAIRVTFGEPVARKLAGR